MRQINKNQNILYIAPIILYILLVKLSRKSYDKIMEIWKSVLGFENIYEVSNLGRVRRIKAGRRTYVGKILKQSTKRAGYKFVLLVKNKKAYCKHIHTLVMEAFNGKRPKNKEVDHINNVKSDNRIINLQYITH